MRKRLLSLWLVVSVLAYGSVWAFDMHLDEPSEHQQMMADGTPDVDAQSAACDHCCHASAHVVALCASFNGIQTAVLSAAVFSYLPVRPFTQDRPPERPPKA